jgi:hypothetical protein
MKKYYFDLDKVSSIHLTLERESDYTWYDEIKPQRRYFLGLPVGWTAGKTGGWCEYEDSKWRKDTEYFEDYKSYRVDLDLKVVFIRPRVTVVSGYKDSYTSYFDTDQEAQQYIDDLIKKSKKNFQVITEN